MPSVLRPAHATSNRGHNALSLDGGMATEALVAGVVVSKRYGHRPLYRQAEILARQGVELDRFSLRTWVGRAYWWLAPRHQLVLPSPLHAARLPPLIPDVSVWPASQRGGTVPAAGLRRTLPPTVAAAK